MMPAADKSEAHERLTEKADLPPRLGHKFAC